MISELCPLLTDECRAAMPVQYDFLEHQRMLQKGIDWILVERESSRDRYTEKGAEWDAGLKVWTSRKMDRRAP